MLAANPTNLHTHGLIVEPRRAGNGDPSYGDYVYVLGYPQGKLPSSVMPGLDFTDKPIDYDIYIPANHPAGFFWFHPHSHGLALNQVSEGLSGAITVGSVNDYLTTRAAPPPTVRHLVLRDMEVSKDSTVVDQEDPGFCDADPDEGEGDRLGYCAGTVYTDDDGVHDYRGGKWFFTLNGQVYPGIDTAPDAGEVWRLVNASGSRTYELALKDDRSGDPLVMQVLSIDGIAIDASGMDGRKLAASFGGKLNPVPCPPTIVVGGNIPVCANQVRMMPSARIELYVPPQGAGGSEAATLVTKAFATGPAGDDWPSAKLAHLVFHHTRDAVVKNGGLHVSGQARAMMQSGGILGSTPVVSFAGMSEAISIETAKQISLGGVAGSRLTQGQLRNLKREVKALESPDCAALPVGHKRRIFFGVPGDNPDAFGLGYEELDADGQPVPGTFRDIAPFDHLSVSVCLPLAAGNKAVTEDWDLVNVSGEDHNFHIHQTRFKVLSGASVPSDVGVMMDNVPVPHGGEECDGTVATWRSGACRVDAVKVEIPFTQIGDFVYHCHILEHEDGGMMAHIRVVANR